MNESIIRNKFLKIQNEIHNIGIKHIALYGTGDHTRKLLDYLDAISKDKIIGLIDQDRNKLNSRIYGYKVYDLNSIRSKVDAIIISSDVYQQTIYDRIAYLKEEGIDIIKIYDEEYFLPTASNIIYENSESKYEVIRLEKSEYEKWNEFVDTSLQGSIFSKTWYLQAVQAPFEIYVCIDRNKEFLGGMVIPELREGCIAMPILTQTLGILLKEFNNIKYVNKISKEKDIIESLVSAIPNFKNYSINFNYNFTNWLPFMWKGYNQYCRYTYVIENLSNLDYIKSGLRNNIKYDINKAIKNGIKIYEDLPIKELYKISEKTYQRQDLNIPYSLELLQYLDKILEEKQARKSFFAIDKHNNIHAANYIIYDKNSAYYLIGGGDAELRTSGATSLALWEAIKFSSKVSKKFDFEGSCIRSIEEFFRGFGGTQKMYFNIWKKNSL